MAGVAIKNFTRQHQKVWAGLPFAGVVEEILPGWDISLVFVGEKKAQDLNKQLRKKSYVPNVLSYVVGEKSGEIIICLKEAERQAPDFQLAPSDFLLLLFIHGALHIKGWSHSAKMDKCEQNLLRKYVPSHSNRNRHRHVSGQAGRR